MGFEDGEMKFFSKVCRRMEKEGLTEWTGNATDDEAFISTERIGQKLEFKAFPGLWEVIDIIPGTVSSTSGGKKNKDSEKYPVVTIKKISNTGLAIKGTDIVLSQHIDKHSHGLLKEGSLCIDRRRNEGDLVKVVDFKIKKVVNYEKTNNDKKNNPLKKEVKDDVVYVRYRQERRDYKGFLGEEKRDDEDKSDRRLDEKTLKEFLGSYAILEYATVEEFEAATEIIAKTGQLPPGLDSGSHEGETGLVSFGSKDYLQTVEQRLQRQRNGASVLRASMDRLLERHKRELEHMRQRAYEIMELSKKQIKKVQRLIVTLEIYLGVEEGVIQIAEGEAAPVDAPISLRQMRLYMDEEVGDTMDGGIDHYRMQQFDEWVVKDGNYKKLIPEVKGVVAMAPRRHDKDYGSDDRNHKERGANQWTYILIRNGDNLYRIYSDHISYTDRLFPKRKELQKMLDHMARLAYYQKMKMEDDNFRIPEIDKERYKELFGWSSYLSERDIEEKADKIKDQLFYYQRNVLMLQGIMFRTDIFVPIPDGLDLLKPDTYINPETKKERVQFIYDDEETLPTNRISFTDWQDKINKGIKKGSRVVISNASVSRKYRGKADTERFVINFNEHNTPSAPSEGLYTVEEYVKVNEFFARVKINKDEYLKLKEKSQMYHNTWSKEKGHGREKQLEIINEGELKRLQKKEWSDNLDFDKIKPNELIETFQLSEHGQKVKVIEKERKLCVRYNPGDTIYGSWGQYDPHTRKVPITYLIYLDSDGDMLNYDEISLDDINFYLESRTDRADYFTMLPVLRTIKKHLLEETEWEKNFVAMLAGQLKTELKLPNIDIEPIIWKAIKWWKDEIVVWKRPINGNDVKAMSMITQRVKKILRDEHGYQKLDTGVDNRKKTLIYKSTITKGKAYVSTGVTKAQFVDMVSEVEDFGVIMNKVYKISLASIERGVTDTNREEYVNEAQENIGKLSIIESGKLKDYEHGNINSGKRK